MPLPQARPRSRAKVLILALFVLAPTALAGHDAEAEAAPAQRFAIGFHSMPSLEEGSTFLGARVAHVDAALRLVAVVTNDAAFQARARADPNVRYVEVETLREWIEYTPNDPLYSSQYPPHTIGLPQAWDTTLGQASVKVCIVDTGVDYNHEDLAGPRWLGGYDYVNGDANPMDDHGHGTHVAGTAVGTIGNGVGIAGTSNAALYATKVLNSGGQGYDSWVASGMRWCADANAHVISMSLGAAGGSSALFDAVEYSWGKGALLVAASGNSGCGNCVGYPAAYSHVVAVACVDWNKDLCYFSSGGPQVAISAPGLEVLSAARGGGYTTKSGTSMSTPHVAGVAALVWSLNPQVDNVLVRSILESSAFDVGSPGRDWSYGFGVVDAKAALDVTPLPAPPETLMFRDFDTGTAPGFELNGLWHVTTACDTAPSSPYHLGYHRDDTCDYDTPLAPNEGQAVFQINLTGATLADVSFLHRHEVEFIRGGVHDMYRVEGRVLPAGGFQTLRQWSSETQPQYEWTREVVGMGSLVGNNVELRFSFTTLDELDNAYLGWRIDDVRVNATVGFAPFPVAGPDRTLRDADSDGIVVVALDGSRSRDVDDGIVAYEWLEGATLLATGPFANVSLAVGAHAMTLRVRDAYGHVAEDPFVVTIVPNLPPIADAGADAIARDGDATGAETITLSASASRDPDGTIDSYAWSRDGVIVGTGAQLTLDLALGEHAFDLEVVDDGGLAATDRVNVTVLANAPPIANAGADLALSDADGDGGQDGTVNGGASSDADGYVASYAWSIDGVELGSSATLTRRFDVGVHTLALRVTDNGGASATDALVVTVNANRPPLADAGADISVGDADGSGEQLVALDGSRSADPDGALAAFEWIEQGTLVATGAAPTVSLAVGEHTLTLRVTDNGGASALDSVRVEVRANAAPIARAFPVAPRADSDGDGIESMTLRDNGSFDPDGGALAYAWLEDGAIIATGAQTNAPFAVGAHDVVLRVTDAGGLPAETSVSVVVVANKPPRPVATVVCVDVECSFDARASSDPDGTIASFEWDLSDGSTLEGATATHRFPDYGSVSWTLRVTDNGGLANATSGNPTLAPVPPIAAPAFPPRFAHARDHVDDGESEAVPHVDVSAAWFEADPSRLYVGLKTRAHDANVRVDHAVEFEPGWSLADPTWGGLVPAGETTIGLRVSRTTTEGFRLVALTTEGERALGVVNGSLSPTTGIVWWHVPFKKLQLTPGVATARAITGSATMPSPTGGEATMRDSTGAGGAFLVRTTARSNETLTWTDFSNNAGAFEEERDARASEIAWDPLHGALAVLVERSDEADEVHARRLSRVLTNASSFHIEASWRVEEQGNWQTATPFFLGGLTVASPETDGNVVRVEYQSRNQNAGDDPQYVISYRDAKKVVRASASVIVPASTKVWFEVDYDKATRELVLTLADGAGVVLARTTYVLGSNVGEGFRVDKVGVATPGQSLTHEAPTLGFVDDVVIREPKP